MASIQQIETRLLQLERMVAYIMNAFKMAVPSKIIGGETKVLSMLDLYRIEQMGLPNPIVGDNDNK